MHRELEQLVVNANSAGVLHSFGDQNLTARVAAESLPNSTVEVEDGRTHRKE